MSAEDAEDAETVGAGRWGGVRVVIFFSAVSVFAAFALEGGIASFLGKVHAPGWIVGTLTVVAFRVLADGAHRRRALRMVPRYESWRREPQ